jgi:hypothetical protein
MNRLLRASTDQVQSTSSGARLKQVLEVGASFRLLRVRGPYLLAVSISVLNRKQTYLLTDPPPIRYADLACWQGTKCNSDD